MTSTEQFEFRDSTGEVPDDNSSFFLSEWRSLFRALVG